MIEESNIQVSGSNISFQSVKIRRYSEVWRSRGHVSELNQILFLTLESTGILRVNYLIMAERNSCSGEDLTDEDEEEEELDPRVQVWNDTALQIKCDNILNLQWFACSLLL